MSQTSTDRYFSVRDDLTKLLADANAIKPANPIGAELKARGFRRRLLELRKQVEAVVSACETIMNSQPVRTRAEELTAIFMTTGLSHRAINLRALTIEVNSCIDQKAAFALAYLALYVSLISLVVSLLGLAVSLLGVT